MGVGLAVVGTVVLVLSDAGDLHEQDGPSTAAGVVKLDPGRAPAAGSPRQWRSRPEPGEEPEMPKWLAGVDGLTPGQGLRPRAAAVGGEPEEPAARHRRRRDHRAGGSRHRSSRRLARGLRAHRKPDVAAPVVYSLLGGEGAAARLDAAKDWLAANNAAVMFVLLLVFGVVLIANGLPPLTS